MSGQLIHVLIVEDEPIILRHSVKQVEALSGAYRVVAGVDNAAGALRILSEQPVDLLLTDIEMAGMSGLELIREAKRRNPALRTVILSGYSSFDYAQTALRYGADDYLLKPVETAQLRQVFEKLADSVLSARKSEPTALPELIERYLRERYNQTVTMEELSGHFSYAPSYVSRVFKRHFGVSPIHFQIRVRMESAKALLRETPPPDIKEVAFSVGYDDARYFSRIFRQFEGVTPSEWVCREKSR